MNRDCVPIGTSPLLRFEVWAEMQVGLAIRLSCREATGLIQALSEDRFSVIDVVPDHESIEISTGGEEDSPLCRLGQTMSELDVFARL